MYPPPSVDRWSHAIHFSLPYFSTPNVISGDYSKIASRHTPDSFSETHNTLWSFQSPGSTRALLTDIGGGGLQVLFVCK